MGTLRRFTREIILVILTILGVVMLPISTSVFCTLFIYREIIIKFAKHFKSDWIPLNLFSCYAAIDDIYNKPVAGIGIVIYLDKKISQDVIFKRMEALIAKQNGAELKCRLARLGGYFFWEPIPNFELSSCLRVNNSDDFQYFDTFKGECVFEPFKKGGPLWEATLFPYVDKNGDYPFLIRWHHSLMDMNSIITLFRNLGDPDPEQDVLLDQIVARITEKYSPKIGILYVLDFLFISVFRSGYMAFNMLKKNEWTKTTITGEPVHHVEQLDLNGVKQISKMTGQSIQTILLTALTGAIGKSMSLNDGTKLDMNFALVFPIPGHPARDKMTNHMWLAPLKLPVSDADHQTRMKSISSQITNLAKSPVLLWLLLGDLFFCLTSSLVNKKFVPREAFSGIISNGITLRKPEHITGIEVSKFEIMTGRGLASVPVVFNFFTVCDYIDFGIWADRGLFNGKEALETFAKRFKMELKALENYKKE